MDVELVAKTPGMEPTTAEIAPHSEQLFPWGSRSGRTGFVILTFVARNGSAQLTIVADST